MWRKIITIDEAADRYLRSPWTKLFTFAAYIDVLLTEYIIY
jgi:hypothetical protein